MHSFPERIVFVDDNQATRTLVREVLESTGYDGALTTCGSGQELLNRIRELQPELVLLDLLMSEMDGLQVLEALAEDPSVDDLSVIMLTGVEKLVMTDEYKKLGMIGIIYKPVDIENFRDQIAEIWNDHHNPEQDSESAEESESPKGDD